MWYAEDWGSLGMENASPDSDDHTEKTVLICLGERKRQLTFCGDNEELCRRVKILFSDVVPKDKSVILQLKHEDWEGQFMDVRNDTVICNRSVLRAVVDNSDG